MSDSSDARGAAQLLNPIAQQCIDFIEPPVLLQHERLIEEVVVRVGDKLRQRRLAVARQREPLDEADFVLGARRRRPKHDPEDGEASHRDIRLSIRRNGRLAPDPLSRAPLTDKQGAPFVPPRSRAIPCIAIDAPAPQSLSARSRRRLYSNRRESD
jgi:hypothetical protein